jgi:hypothetical protein
MKRLTSVLGMALLLFALLTGASWLAGRDKRMDHGNSIVMDARAITEIVPVGPIGGSFLLRQAVNPAQINFRPEFLDSPVCISVFMDSNFPYFKDVPFRLSLVSGEERFSLTLGTARIKNHFDRICFPDLRLGQLQGRPLSVEIGPESPAQQNVARIILTPHKRGAPAEIDGKVTQWSLPMYLEVQRPISPRQWASIILLHALASLVLALGWSALRSEPVRVAT